MNLDDLIGKKAKKDIISKDKTILSNLENDQEEFVKSIPIVNSKDWREERSKKNKKKIKEHTQ